MRHARRSTARLAELRDKKLAAINNRQIGSNQFDHKIQKAEETEEKAEQAYRDHVTNHGCA